MFKLFFFKIKCGLQVNLFCDTPTHITVFFSETCTALNTKSFEHLRDKFIRPTVAFYAYLYYMQHVV